MTELDERQRNERMVRWVGYLFAAMTVIAVTLLLLLWLIERM